MAEDGSWLSIEKEGLLSTSALLTLYRISGSKRNDIEEKWRPCKVTISCNGLQDAVIRDQKVMPPEDLEICLTGGMTPQDWYRLINGKVFLWANRQRLEWFLSANEYKNSPHIVVEVDTRDLLERHADRVTLTNFNSGSTLYSRPYTKPRSRGRRSFVSVAEYPGYAADGIVEVAVEKSIPEISEIAISAERWIARETGYRKVEYERLAQIWHR